MPLCHVFTNLAANALKVGIEARLAHILSDTLKKPLEVSKLCTQLMLMGTSRWVDSIYIYILESEKPRHFHSLSG